MSSTDGDPASSLSSALDDLFARRAAGQAGESQGASDAVDGDDTDPTGAPTFDDEFDGELDREFDRADPADDLPPALADIEDDEPAAAADPTVPYVLPDIVPATEPVVAPADADAAAPAPSVASGPSVPPAAANTSAPTGWGDHMPVVNAAGAGELRAAGRRPRVRRVTRVVRHVDPWSVFKVGLIFSAVAYVVMLSSGVLLWRVADSTGSLDNVERWFTQFGWETFEFKGDEIFHNAWIIGLFGAVAMTGAFVLLATLFNLVSDIVGGIRVTVLEEEVVERTMSNARRYVVRRPVTEGATAAAPGWSVDDDEPAGAPPAAPATSATPAAPAESADWSVDD